MKVVHVAKEYPPYVYGGVGMHLKYLTQALARMKDVDVDVRAFHGVDRTYRPPTSAMDGHPFVTYYCPPSRFISYQYSKVLDTLLLGMDWASEPTDADIFHTHTWYANMVNVLAKRLHDVATISTVHSLEPLRPWKAQQLTPGGHALSSWMEMTGLLDADRVIAVSRDMAADVERLIGVERSRISVIPNGVDLNMYRPSDDPVRAEVLDDTPYVLFVGRLSKQKGVEDLIEAWKHTSKEGRKLVMITGKEDTPGLVKETRDSLDGIDDILWLHGQREEREMVKFYQGADLFVCPSRYEPFGIINLEAMACGVPVVATAVGGIKEVVTPLTGLLVEPGNPDALADGMGRLLGDSELRARMSAAGRPYVEENFGWDAIAGRTARLYREVLGER